MAQLVDEKDAVKAPATQAAEYLTSQRNGLHFRGRRRDRGRFSSRTTLPTHTHRVSEGLAASLLCIWSPFLKEELRNNFELLMGRTASACVPFLNPSINQKGKAEHTRCRLNSVFSKKPRGCFEID